MRADAKTGRSFIFWIILFLVVGAYWPSLRHIPRHDQVAYWAETTGRKELMSLTFGSMTLNRQRQFNPGDQQLFRPGLYFFMGLEKYFFGRNFLLWQAAGILLHLLCVWQLWKLLAALGDYWMALGVTAVFSLLLVNVEMVIWSNVNAYIIAAFCFLRALRCFLQDARAPGDNSACLAHAAALLSVGALFYEMLAFFSAAYYLYFRWMVPGRQQKAWYLLCPVLFFWPGILLCG